MGRDLQCPSCNSGEQNVGNVSFMHSLQSTSGLFQSCLLPKQKIADSYVFEPAIVGKEGTSDHTE